MAGGSIAQGPFAGSDGSTLDGGVRFRGQIAGPDSPTPDGASPMPYL